MGGGGKFFVVLECQLMNVEEMTGFLKNHQLANITVVTDSGKNCQWMPKPQGESLMRNGIFT